MMCHESKGVCVYILKGMGRKVSVPSRKGLGRSGLFSEKEKPYSRLIIYTKKSENVTCHKLRQFCVYITQRNKESIMKKTLLNITETSSQYVITWVFNERMERWEIEDVEKV